MLLVTKLVTRLVTLQCTSDGAGTSTGRVRVPRFDRAQFLAVGAPAVTGATRETRAGGKGTGKEDKDNGKGPAQAQGKGKAAAAADDPQAPVDPSDKQPAHADSDDESEDMTLDARTARLDALPVAPAAAAAAVAPPQRNWLSGGSVTWNYSGKLDARHGWQCAPIGASVTHDEWGLCTVRGIVGSDLRLELKELDSGDGPWEHAWARYDEMTLPASLVWLDAPPAPARRGRAAVPAPAPAPAPACAPAAS